MKQKGNQEEETHNWEMYKENAAPLERGRNVKELSKTLASKSNEYIEKTKHRYESLLKEQSSEEDSDILITWLEYIKFIQEHNPSDTQCTFLLLERCTRSLLQYKKYHQDTKFLRVCILYADRTSNPNDIYKYLFERKVGVENALFWVAWAWVAEKNGDFTFADKVYSKAIKKGAEPFSMIDTRYKQFQRRMSRHWLNQQSNAEEESGRGTLTALTEDGVRHNQRSRADNVEYYVDENTGRRVPITNRRSQAGNVTGTTRRAAPSFQSTQRNNSSSGFQIFTDTSTEKSFLNDSTVHDHHHHRHLPKQADVTKENTMSAQRWNESSLHRPNDTHRSQQHQPAPPSFEVFEDPECKQDKQSPKRSNHHNVLSQTKPIQIADKLKSDPLRYVRNPDKLKQDQKHSRHHDEHSKHQEKKKEPSNQYGFNKRLLAMGGEETCFEECRAKRNYFTTCHENINLIKIDEPDDSTMDISMEDDDSDIDEQSFDAKSYKNQSYDKSFLSTSTNHRNNLHQSIFHRNNTSTDNINTSFASAASSVRDPTINTKLAVKELSAMFASSPVQDISSIHQNKSFLNRSNASPTKKFFDQQANKSYFTIMEDESIHDQHNNSILNKSTVSIAKFQEVKRSKTAAFTNDENCVPIKHDNPNNTKKKPLGVSSIPQSFDIHQDDVDNDKPNNCFSIHNESDYENNIKASNSNGSTYCKIGQSMKELHVHSATSSPAKDKKRALNDTKQNLSKISMGFEIFSEDSEDENCKSSAPFEIFSDVNEVKQNNDTKASFQIFNDDGENNSEHSKFSNNKFDNKQHNSAIGSFQIFNDENNNIDQCNNKFNFAIHTDDTSVKNNMENGDTATFSLFNEACNEIDHVTSLSGEKRDDHSGHGNNKYTRETTDERNTDKSTSKEIDSRVDESNISYLSHHNTVKNSSKNKRRPSIASLLRTRSNKSKDCQKSDSFEILNDEVNKSEDSDKIASFEIHIDGVGDDDSDTIQNGGDTATFSLFNEALQGIEYKGTRNDEKKNKDKSLLRSTRYSSRLLAGKPQRCITDVSAFNDVSRITVDDSSVSYKTDIEDDDKVIDFDTLHKQDSNWALDQAIREAERNDALEASASVETLEWNDKNHLVSCLVEDRTSERLPAGLTRKNPAKYINVDLGGLVKSSVVVMNELGRGGYGVVLLCDKVDDKDQSTNLSLALKVQTPTGSLAWEYNVLTKLEERLQPAPKRRRCRYQNSINLEDSFYNAKSNRGALPYPRALSFSMYSDGSVLAMTAASTTGLTLVDVVNCHKKAGVGPVPELLTMHYTVKMLLLIENMHWNGKILHCDVKPDNWVLSALKDPSGDSVIEGGDLMLVDFGRSIDLQRVSEETKEQPFHLRFTGNVAAKDFECVAMREGKPWGTDVDTYGLCATAHALLHGSYMKVEKNHVSGRWFPQKPLRRYWNKELWTTLFDTLLNAGGKYSNSGSHPDSLRSIRKSFEEYLDQGNRRSQIRSLLRHQVDYFPSVSKGS